MTIVTHQDTKQQFPTSWSEKELLFIVKGGESYDETITLHNKYDNEKTIYIILESTGKCVDGYFEFEYN